MKKNFTIIATLICLIASACLAQTTPAPADEGLNLTVYNGGYAVVRETRKLTVNKDGTAKFIDVPTAIDATTVHFKSITDPAAVLLEQNYQFDLVSADKLLQKYIDKPLDVVVKDKDKSYSGTLMSFDPNQLVLKEDGGGSLVMIQRADNVRDIRFKSLPEGLLTKPTLLWQLKTTKPGDQLAEVSYQTHSMGWHVEYVLVLNGDDTAADLSGWVSVQNNSGKTYNNAHLKFIAGDVRRVQEARPQREMVMEKLAEAKDDSAGMVEKAFFEYHMYTLPRPSTVADNEIKQLEMFSPVSGLKVEKKYLYAPTAQFHWYGGTYTDPSYGVTSEKKVNIFIEFKNSEANKLGIPLPAGKVRVYKNDPDDKAMEFVGEEKIDHTPQDENLSLQIGNAFDVVGERKQTKFTVDTSRKMMTESFEIKIRNHKKQDITVRVKESLYRWSSWEITAKSHDFKQLDSRTIAFDVPVKADGETVVTYTVEYKW